VLSARATRGLELGLFLALVSPLLIEWYETTHASSRLSYALLVPALALALVLRDRGGPSPEPGSARARAWLAGSAALAAALALLAGGLSGVFTLSLLAVPLGAVAFTARALGLGELRRRAPALALLFLMVPPPMPLLDRFNPFLIQASGASAVALLTPFDPAVGWEGSTLLYRGWSLIVAEACSGSGTFLMLGTLCAFLVALFRLRGAAAVALLALALPVALLVNGVRIASSALVIDSFGAAAGEGLAHELLGQVVVVLGAGLLVLAVERWTARATRRVAVSP
jgi:exosortase